MIQTSHAINPVHTVNHHLVGGGIAALSAATFLIRDAGVPGELVHIYEQLSQPGGSLDGSGNPTDGYLVRGGRMFEKHFACTFDLLSTIPAPNDPSVSVKDDIMNFNQTVPGSSNCRLVEHGHCTNPVHLGLSQRNILDLIRLLVKPERSLAGRTIGSCFGRSFFDTGFWTLWSTMFSFQPWHSAMEMRRYLHRFIHLFPGFSRIAGILRTRYNQYDAIIVPIVDWLKARGVKLEMQCRVEDVVFDDTRVIRQVTELHIDEHGQKRHVKIGPDDRVYITLGSMTESSTTGSNETPAIMAAEQGGAWSLWKRLAERHSDFGNPESFCNDLARTNWTSFTVTLDNDDFISHMEEFTDNRTGTGGLVTFQHSGWLMSIVIFKQPHFLEQDCGKSVFWGYGLRGDRPGSFITKSMRDCTGLEILDELAGLLELGEKAAPFFAGAKVIPCTMPYITSQFMPRRAGDRPLVIPENSHNLALIGQYCEQPRDTVFTVEYSVRSAMTAVHALTTRGKAPPPVYRSDLNPLVLARAAKTLVLD